MKVFCKKIGQWNFNGRLDNKIKLLILINLMNIIVTLEN